MAELQRPTKRQHPARSLSCRAFRALPLAAALVSSLHAGVVLAARSCDDWHATFTSVEGSVEVQRQSAGGWIPVTRGDVLCTDDTVRVLRSARALVELPDGSALRLDENTSFRLPEPKSGIGTLIDLIRGAIHVISRDPRSLSFQTPFMNAGLEGTEFDIRVGDAETTVAVLEGQVLATNSSGVEHVPSGYVATAGEHEAPRSAPGEPVALMRWTSHYAEIIDGPLPAPDAEPNATESTRAQFFTARAAARLATGRLAGAESDLGTALMLAPSDAAVPALRSIIEVARGRPEEAMRLAGSAVALDPEAATPLIALSYAQQASAENEDALRSIEHAVELDGTNAIAWSRLAELRLATGDFDGAMAAATRAKTLRPTLGYPETVLGFAYLDEFDTQAALDAFRRAADLDQGSPLPHLGLGLALIADRNVAEGRRELESAVALDPTNATMRSYVAKVYSVEHRQKLTSSQLGLAKRFDPSDPTPFLYDALHQLNENRPVEALQDLDSAIERNGNQPAFRSRFRLDEDAATQSAGIGRVYRELGFEQLALSRGWQAIERDPMDYAGHRLLADVYSTTPRHEIVRVNELLQSQLLQPANLRPIQPDLALPSLFVLDAVAPNNRSYSEFSPLLTKNGLRFQGSTISSGNDTLGESLALSGLNDKLSYSFGAFRFKTDGFRENNDLDQRVANAFVQYRPTHATSLQAELRSTNTKKGDLAIDFDPTAYLKNLRTTDSDDSLRLGVRHDLSARRTLLASVIFRDNDASLTPDGTLSLAGHRRGYSVDLQHIYRGERWRTYSGGLFAHERGLETTDLIAPVAISLSAERRQFRQSALYTYALVDATSTLTMTLGASFNSFGPDGETAFNPKVGLTWRPTSRTTVRAATFTTLEGSLSTSKQDLQPRLEPGQLAGFSQFLLGANGDEARVKGLAVDNEIATNLFAGVEVSRRSFKRPFQIVGAGAGVAHIDEQLRRGYLYWTPADRLAFSAEYQLDDGDSPDQAFFGAATELHSARLPLALHYFAPIGITAGFRASRVSQEGQFDLGLSPPGAPPVTQYDHDRFWVFDASVGYRLPNRRGMLSLNVANLLNQKFHFQDTDPENPSFMPERLVSLRVTVAFE